MIYFVKITQSCGMPPSPIIRRHRELTTYVYRLSFKVEGIPGEAGEQVMAGTVIVVR